jgi:hypothetical protein
VISAKDTAFCLRYIQRSCSFGYVSFSRFVCLLLISVLLLFPYQDVIVLVRRIIIVAVVTLGSHAKSLRLTYVSIVNILVLLAQMACNPYGTDLDNINETFVLVVIALISVALSTAPSPLTFTYQVALSLLFFVSFAYLLVRMVISRYEKIQRARRASSMAQKGEDYLSSPSSSAPSSSLPPLVATTSSSTSSVLGGGSPLPFESQMVELTTLAPPPTLPTNSALSAESALASVVPVPSTTSSLSLVPVDVSSQPTTTSAPLARQGSEIQL